MEGFASANAFPQTPSAPPPPPEVRVRTMRSDLEAMNKSGGNVPRFESVKFSSLPVVAAPSASDHKFSMPKIPGMGNVPGDNKIWVIALIVLSGLAALALIAYLIYKIFT